MISVTEWYCGMIPRSGLLLPLFLSSLIPTSLPSSLLSLKGTYFTPTMCQALVSCKGTKMNLR